MKTCPSCKSTHPDEYLLCPRDGTRLVVQGAWAEGTLVRGKYRILNKVGQGGMGAVYKALHVAFDEIRALKVISPELAKDQLFVRRFRQEAILTRKLQHEHAVRVEDLDEDEERRPFIVMEFVEGPSLKTLIRDKGPLAIDRILRVGQQICSALEAAHEAGMIHRDIKPDNVVLVPLPLGGESVKVLDFGIAKLREGKSVEGGLTLTGTGVVIGTPQYMSPEQAMGKRGDQLDGRSDLYSLGVVMYEMLTGVLPFQAETTMEMILHHLQTPPPPPRELKPDLQIPEPVAQLIMRTLEKKREGRPANASELGKEIDQVLDQLSGRGTLALTPPTPDLDATVKISSRDIRTSPRASLKAEPPPEPVPEPVPEPSPEPLPDSLPAPAPAPAPDPPPVSSAPPHPEPVRLPPLPVHARTQEKSGTLRGVGLIIVAVAAVAMGWFWMRSTQGPTAGEPETISPAPIVRPESSTEVPAASVPASPSPEQQPSRVVDTPPREEPPVASTSQPPPPPPSTRQRPAVTIRQPVRRSPETTSAPRRNLEALRNRVRERISLGDFHINRGEYDQAIAEYRKALELVPSNAGARTKLNRARRAQAAEKRLGTLNQ
ncbi:MAG: protein kinase [Acidobacteriota bacterium]